jgi:hypothetical protein
MFPFPLNRKYFSWYCRLYVHFYAPRELQSWWTDSIDNRYLRVVSPFLYMNWPPLWFNGLSSWLQIQRSGFDSRRYHIFWEVVGLKRGQLSLVSTIEELLGRKSSGCSLECREYGSRNPSHWPRGTLYPQKLAVTSPTWGGRLVGIFR